MEQKAQEQIIETSIPNPAESKIPPQPPSPPNNKQLWKSILFCILMFIVLICILLFKNDPKKKMQNYQETSNKKYISGAPQSLASQKAIVHLSTAEGYADLSIASNSLIGTAAAEIKAIGLVPTQPEFIGGIYYFQPYSLAFSPPGELVLAINKETKINFPLSKYKIYQLNPTEDIWEPLKTTISEEERTAKAQIRSLGVYTLGYDTVSPIITVSTIFDNQHFLKGEIPYMRGSVHDTGVGVNYESIHVQLDGKPLTISLSKNGSFDFTPSSLDSGPHTFTITAQDTIGNQATKDITLYIDNN